MPERSRTGSKRSQSEPDTLSDVDIESAVVVLKALAHPVRYRIVDLIHRHGGELCVCELERHFDLTQPTISHHLKTLRNAGVIRSRQDGTWVRHAIEPNALAWLAELIEQVSRTEAPA